MRCSSVTPTHARAIAINASRTITRNANIALYLNAAAAHVRPHARGDKLYADLGWKKVKSAARPQPAGLGLTCPGRALCSLVMLQHNGTTRARPAHLAHATMMGLHALCCGLPALALTAAALSGAVSGVTLLSDSVGKLHDFLHQHEIWVLVISAALVVVGGWLEISGGRRHRHGFPWLFSFSVFCFLANLAIILFHRAI